MTHDDDFSPFPEPVEIPIEDSIDLHLFRPREVKEVVLEYLDLAREKGYLEVRVIHGRGIGELRRMVRTLLERHPGVAEFSDAPAGRGGWGATLVRFHPPDAESPAPSPPGEAQG